jgi:hypothetical protein
MAYEIETFETFSAYLSKSTLVSKSPRLTVIKKEKLLQSLYNFVCFPRIGLFISTSDENLGGILYSLLKALNILRETLRAPHDQSRTRFNAP